MPVIGYIKAPQPKSCYYAFHAEIKAAALKAGNKSKFLGVFFALVPSCLNVLNDGQCQKQKASVGRSAGKLTSEAKTFARRPDWGRP